MKVEKKIRKRLRKKRQRGTGGRRKVRQRKKILVMMTLRDKFERGTKVFNIKSYDLIYAFIL